MLVALTSDARLVVTIVCLIPAGRFGQTAPFPAGGPSSGQSGRGLPFVSGRRSRIAAPPMATTPASAMPGPSPSRGDR
jgi:hypothetical protein